TVRIPVSKVRIKCVARGEFVVWLETAAALWTAIFPFWHFICRLHDGSATKWDHLRRETGSAELNDQDGSGEVFPQQPKREGDCED
ncbi:hypothetical protein BKA82DRAFT_1002253, partial [Pisolithus tinctorius]